MVLSKRLLPLIPGGIILKYGARREVRATAQPEETAGTPQAGNVWRREQRFTSMLEEEAEIPQRWVVLIRLTAEVRTKAHGLVRAAIMAEKPERAIQTGGALAPEAAQPTSELEEKTKTPE